MFKYSEVRVSITNRRVIEMAGPYRCTNMVVQIVDGNTTYTVGVVEGMDIDLSYNGGPEPTYGTRIQKHSAGSKIAKFTITRWYYTDTGQEDLLLDLFDDETEFSLVGYLVDSAGSEIKKGGVSATKVTITGCRIYRWRPKTGGADDIIGEEASGSGTDWDLDVDKSTP
jgi:hypothetical protein